jgi:hypothetical protein
MTKQPIVFFGELLIRLSAPGNELLMQSPRLVRQANIGAFNAGGLDVRR